MYAAVFQAHTQGQKRGGEEMKWTEKDKRKKTEHTHTQKALSGMPSKPTKDQRAPKKGETAINQEKERKNLTQRRNGEDGAQRKRRRKLRM